MSDPWDDWEDYAAGFYNPGIPTAMHEQDSRELLTDPDRFYYTAIEMMDHWVNSARHNLVYMWTGRNAWVGQASCLYSHGAPPAATRAAWATMTDTQREEANAVATRARQEWGNANDGRKTLFRP